jgi:hypothetical protein
MEVTNISSNKLVNDNLYLVDDYGIKYSSDGSILISVPKDIVSYQVVYGTKIIAREAFKDSAVQEVIIPDTITTLEHGAFSGCRSLRNINLPQSITKIEYDAFYNCKNLKIIWLPRCIDGIHNDTFRGCDSLERIYIPSSIGFIGLGAFMDCVSLRSLLIPVMASIEAYAFSGCTVLSEIHLPIISKHIEDEVFERCVSLKSVDYWYDYIPARTFAGCTNLESLKIMGKIQMVEDDAFYFCDSLRRVEFCVAPHPQFNDFSNFFKSNETQEIEFVIPSGTERQFVELYELAQKCSIVKITVKSDHQSCPAVEQDKEERA